MKKNLLFLKHLQRWWAWWAALLGVIYLIYKVNSPIADYCRDWLMRHATAKNGAVAFDAWPPAVLAVAFFVTVSLLALSVFTIVMLVPEKGKLEEETRRNGLLLSAFQRTIEATDLITKKLFPVAALPIKKVVSCRQIYTIYEKGDCHFQEELVLCAKDKPIHYVEKSFEADPDGDPAEFPEQINLTLESMTGNKQVSYLISKNEPRSKNVVVFFLPFIQLAPPDERTLKTTFYWSGLMRRLVERGQEDFENDVKSVDPVPLVEYQFWVKPNMGDLTCIHVGVALEDDTETLTEDTNNNGMHGWIYRGRNLPLDHVTRLRLELKRS